MTIGRDTRITWYGHSVVGIDTPGGKRIIIDPFFANPRSPINAAQVDRCDLLLVTHGHFDHMGDAVALGSRFKPTWPCIHEMSLWLARRLPGGQDAAIGMNKGGTVAVGDIRVTMVHADHTAGDWNPGGETTLDLGEPVGFVIELENGFRIYHSGDTDVFGDMRLIRELHRPDFAMLPIGDHYTMGPRAAALAVELLGVKQVMPLHYGTFPVLVGTPEQWRQELQGRGLGDVRVHAPQPGETID